MQSQPEWNDERNEAWSRLGVAGMGALRVALLFGSLGIALALILTPIAEKRGRTLVARNGVERGLDHLATGSVGSRTRTYTIRRSVLQPFPGDPCYVGDGPSASRAC